MHNFYATHSLRSVVDKAMWREILLATSFGLLIVSTIFYLLAEYDAQKCVTIVTTAQIGSLANPNMSSTVPTDVMAALDNCVFGHVVRGALFLGASSVFGAVLGAILSNRLIAGPPTNVFAHYEPDASKLILRFDRPVIAQNPQKMVLLYRHAGGMAAAVPGRQCGDDNLMLVFTTDVEESPTRMELVVYSGAMHSAGFPKLDVCVGGRPIHVDVDILDCG